MPDLDKKIHKKGPPDLNGVKEVDQQLQSLLQTFGSPEEALNKAIFIIAGDSGMTQILPAQENPVIDLPSFFKDYNVLRPVIRSFEFSLRGIFGCHCKTWI